MIIVQILGTVFIFVITFLFGILPTYFNRLKHSDVVISCVNSFSSGIFLAISFLDLMPEANEIYYSQSNQNNHKYPICFLIMIISYSFVLILEKILFNSHSLLEVNHQHQQNHNKQTNMSMQRHNGNINQSTDLQYKLQQQSDSDSIRDRRLDNKMFSVEDMHQNQSIDNQQILKQLINQKHYIVNNLVKQCDSNMMDEYEIPKQTNINQSLILLAALSFHGFFEGIAIGLQSNIKGLMKLLLVVSLHKWAEGFTLGNSLNRNRTDKNIIYLITGLFSFVCPVGIWIGVGLGNCSGGILKAVFFSISSGTFMFIAASELIVEEFTISKHKFIKLGFYMMGILTLVGLQLIEGIE